MPEDNKSSAGGSSTGSPSPDRPVSSPWVLRPEIVEALQRAMPDEDIPSQLESLYRYIYQDPEEEGSW
jgi:hypothetical protein